VFTELIDRSLPCAIESYLSNRSCLCRDYWAISCNYKSGFPSQVALSSIVPSTIFPYLLLNASRNHIASITLTNRDGHLEGFNSEVLDNWLIIFIILQRCGWVCHSFHVFYLDVTGICVHKGLHFEPQRDFMTDNN
jgi:hypothetical protein